MFEDHKDEHEEHGDSCLDKVNLKMAEYEVDDVWFHNHAQKKLNELKCS